MRQLERFANATRTPVGFMFLSSPPREEIPIPDFRTVAGRTLERPSPDLLETIYIAQRRQDWYRSHARANGLAEVTVVGAASLQDDPQDVAASIRQTLAFTMEERKSARTWEAALTHFSEQAEAIGILVTRSGIVGNNTHRPLDPAEFRGFALSDSWAPLVFVNGADARAAQMFTLAHELAHVWLGETGLSDLDPVAPSITIERWCNHVAAEVLIPLHEARQIYDQTQDAAPQIPVIARHFKVSALVVLRRLLDAEWLNRETFRALYEAELARIAASRTPSGGDYYRTTASRVSKRLVRAVVSGTLEGQTSFTEAFQLLGCKDTRTFRKLSETVGIPV